MIGDSKLTKSHDECLTSPLLSANIAGKDCPAAVVKFRLHGPAVVVGLTGEIDATNAVNVTEYVHRFMPDSRPLILDVTDVGFLGVDGIRALIELADECRRAGVVCAVVAGQSVIRLLRAIGRRDAVLTAATVAEALQRSDKPTGAR
jgi:anti-anti-sigma factor